MTDLEAGGDSSDLRQYVFPNLRVYINFTVTAVNIVGAGESASKVSEPCEQQRGRYDSSKGKWETEVRKRKYESEKKVPYSLTAVPCSQRIAVSKRCES